ncbi:MAG TPA: dTDP-glucose 4,6-dehydratase [Steroidobacteraceae bacterium]|nr:dTDP-glucose 4,6-dehydratase [Steroidobacteraceae bacterium]
MSEPLPQPVLFVTGGCGFIGANFVLDWLRNERGTVVNLDKLTYAGNPANLAAVAGDPRYTFVQGDICDAATVAGILERHAPTAIVHFAAESHVDRSIVDPSSFLTTNVLGTMCLLDAAREYWQRLSGQARDRFRFLHVSTDEVYGSLEPEAPAFTETTRYAPNSPYAASKAASDHLVRAWHHTYGLPTLITNCSNNYGPFQFPEKLIPLLICNALGGKPLPIYGDGSNVRDWLYVEDHCQAIRRVLATGTPGMTYNVGGGSERTNLQVVEGLCAALTELRPPASGRSYSSLITFVADRPGHDKRYAIDTSFIESALGWRPRESFENGLRKTVAWYLANEPWLQSVRSGTYLEWMKRNYDERAVAR